MKIAVTGRSGRLGNELICRGCVPLPCDITKEDTIKKALDEVQPDVLINCAAYTDVDGAETPEGTSKALKVNFWGVDNLNKNFTEGRFIHFSTDYVFGNNRGAFPENYVYRFGKLKGSPRYDPINSYCSSKIGGEIVFLLEPRQGKHLIRTTGLYGGCSGKHDFLKLVVGSLSQGKPLSVTDELIGNQTYIPHLAEAVMKIALGNQAYPSIINIASKDIVSRYEFAKMIADVFDLDESLLSPCKNEDVPTWIAERPKKGGLRVKLAEKLGLPIYTILDGLHDAREIEHD